MDGVHVEIRGQLWVSTLKFLLVPETVPVLSTAVLHTSYLSCELWCPLSSPHRTAGMTMTSNFIWILQMQAHVLTSAQCGALKEMPPPHKFLAFEYLVSTIQKCSLVGGSILRFQIPLDISC